MNDSIGPGPMETHSNCKGKEIFNQLQSDHDKTEEIMTFWKNKFMKDLGCFPPFMAEKDEIYYEYETKRVRKWFLFHKTVEETVRKHKTVIVEKPITIISKIWVNNPEFSGTIHITGLDYTLYIKLPFPYDEDEVLFKKVSSCGADNITAFWISYDQVLLNITKEIFRLRSDLKKDT